MSDELPMPMSRPVAVTAIPVDGTLRTVTATPDERAAITKAFGLLALDSLTAELELARGRRDSVTVVGRVRAELVQACVVTVEPVRQSMDAEFSLRLIPEAQAGPARPVAEVVVDPLAEDPPDLYRDGIVDLGAIVLEHFALFIDPYPRAPGAELPAVGEEPNAAEESPFGALAALRREDES